MNAPVQIENHCKPMEAATAASGGGASFRSVLASHIEEAQKSSSGAPRDRSESAADADGSVGEQSESSTPNKTSDGKNRAANKTQSARAEAPFIFLSQCNPTISVPPQWTTPDPSASDVAHLNSESSASSGLPAVLGSCSEERQKSFENPRGPEVATDQSSPSNSRKAAQYRGIHPSVVKEPLERNDFANENGTEGIESYVDAKSFLAGDKNRAQALAPSGDTEHGATENQVSLSLAAERILESCAPALAPSGDTGHGATGNHVPLPLAAERILESRAPALAPSGDTGHGATGSHVPLPLAAERILESRAPATDRSGALREIGQNLQTGPDLEIKDVSKGLKIKDVAKDLRIKDVPKTDSSSHRSQNEGTHRNLHTSRNAADVSAEVHGSDATRPVTATKFSGPTLTLDHTHSADDHSSFGQTTGTMTADTGSIASNRSLPEADDRRSQATSSPSSAELPERPNFAQLSNARLIERVGDSELKIGMRSGDLGTVEIRTSIVNRELTAQISVAHADLSAAIAAEIPALQARLQGQHSPTVNILLHDSGGLMSGGSGAGAQQQPAHQQAELATLVPTARANPPRSTAVSPSHIAATASLDIRA